MKKITERSELDALYAEIQAALIKSKSTDTKERLSGLKALPLYTELLLENVLNVLNAADEPDIQMASLTHYGYTSEHFYVGVGRIMYALGLRTEYAPVAYS